MKLTLKDFKRTGSSFAPLYTYKIKDAGEICLEACLNGYDVGMYTKKLDLIGEKECTNIEGGVGSEFGYAIRGAMAMKKALVIANRKLKEYEQTK